MCRWPVLSDDFVRGPPAPAGVENQGDRLSRGQGAPRRDASALASGQTVVQYRGRYAANVREDVKRVHTELLLDPRAAVGRKGR